MTWQVFVCWETYTGLWWVCHSEWKTIRDTRRWLCARGKYTATCDRVTNFFMPHTYEAVFWFFMSVCVLEIVCPWLSKPLLRPIGPSEVCETSSWDLHRGTHCSQILVWAEFVRWHFLLMSMQGRVTPYSVCGREESTPNTTERNINKNFWWHQ
jgi:hypothetical protein